MWTPDELWCHCLSQRPKSSIICNSSIARRKKSQRKHENRNRIVFLIGGSVRAQVEVIISAWQNHNCFSRQIDEKKSLKNLAEKRVSLRIKAPNCVGSLKRLNKIRFNCTYHNVVFTFSNRIGLIGDDAREKIRKFQITKENDAENRPLNFHKRNKNMRKRKENPFLNGRRIFGRTQNRHYSDTCVQTFLHVTTLIGMKTSINLRLRIFSIHFFFLFVSRPLMEV